MAKVVFKNTFLALESTEVEPQTARRRACSERPYRHDEDGDMQLELQLQRLGKLTERWQPSESVAPVDEIAKLPIASQLAMSSLAAIGMKRMQQRMEAVYATSFAGKLSDVGRVSSSSSVSTMAPEDSDSSEGSSRRRERQSQPTSRCRDSVPQCWGSEARATRVPGHRRQELRALEDLDGELECLCAPPEVESSVGVAWADDHWTASWHHAWTTQTPQVTQRHRARYSRGGASWRPRGTNVGAWGAATIPAW